MPAAITAPTGIDLGVERDPEISDLIKRLQSLTPQQTRVLGMLAEGLLNKQIAYELGVSEATIKAHVSAVLQKLGVDSRTQAVILFVADRRRSAAARQSEVEPVSVAQRALFGRCRRHAADPRHQRAQHGGLQRLVDDRHVDQVGRGAHLVRAVGGDQHGGRSPAPKRARSLRIRSSPVSPSRW